MDAPRPPLPPGPRAAGAGNLCGWPITQGFHSGHPALDVGVPIGVDLFAMGAGTVRQALDGSIASAGGGNWTTLVLDVPFRYGGFVYGTVCYGHANAFAVPNGSHVAAGQRIAWSGNTGRSTGAHLHICAAPFWGADYIDPRPLLAAVTATPAPVPTNPPPAPIPAPREDPMLNVVWQVHGNAMQFIIDVLHREWRALVPDEANALRAAGWPTIEVEAGGFVHRLIAPDGTDPDDLTYRQL